MTPRRSFLRNIAALPAILAGFVWKAPGRPVGRDEIAEALAGARGKGFITLPMGHDALFVTLPNGDVAYKDPRIKATPADFGRTDGVVYGDPDDVKARLLDALMASNSLGWECDPDGPGLRPATKPDDEYKQSPVGKDIGVGSSTYGGTGRRDREDSLIRLVAIALRRYRHYGVYFAVEFVGFLARMDESSHGLEVTEGRFRVVPLPENPATVDSVTPIASHSVQDRSCRV